MRPHVLLTGASRVFRGETPALEPTDLAIEEGAFVAVIGPSGCGKSTLLRLIAGLDAPTAGVVEVDGQRPKEQLRARRRGERAPLAVVFQDACLLPWRSVLDNIALPLELRGVPRSEARGAALGPLEEVELADARDRYPSELSGGMRMRVSIARALATQPKLLLMDEPFGALDEITRHRLDDRLRALWQRHGMTVLFVTHSLAEAAFLAERAIVLSARPGRVVLDRRIDLPRERGAGVRTTLAFAREEALLYSALEDGVVPFEPRISTRVPSEAREQEMA